MLVNITFSAPLSNRRSSSVHQYSQVHSTHGNGFRRGLELTLPLSSPPNEVLCIRALYEASNTVPPPKLTPSQSKWQQQYGVDFTRIWNRIHSIQCAPQLRSLLWRIYAKCLPIVRGSQPAALCPFCQQPESTLHIFFECTSPQQITNILQPIFISWFGSPQQWSPPSVLPLQPNLRNPKLHLHAIATVLRVIWIRRNIAKFEGTNPVTWRNTYSLHDRNGACYFSQMETPAAEHSEPNPNLHGPY